MDAVTRAAQYGAEAARLLLRRPSLLLLALVFCATAPVDTQLIGYLFSYRTPLGAELRREVEQERRKGHTAAEARLRREYYAGTHLLVTSPSAPAVWARTGLTIAWGLAYRPTGKPVDSKHESPGQFGYFLVLWLLYSPLTYALAAFTAGGYWSLMRAAVAGEGLRWSTFFSGGRRLFWRLVLTTIAFLAIHYPVSKAQTAFPGPAGVAIGWALVAGVLWLLLWEPAIVWDDVSALKGLRRSADLVSKDGAAALILGASVGLVQWLAAWPYWKYGERLGDLPATVAQLQSLLSAGLAVHALWAVTGAWFCAAVLIWCREESRKEAQAAEAARSLDIIV